MTFLISFDYWYKNFLLLLMKNWLFKTISNKKPFKKIIVFRTGSIGDNICALPALSVIKNNFPDAQIDILTNSGSASNVSLDKLIDQSQFNSIINYFGVSKKQLIKDLKKNNYDLFIELPQYDASLFRQIRTMLFVRVIGVKHAFGWRISQTMIFKKFQEKNIVFLNERDRLLAILKDNNLAVSDWNFVVANDPAQTESAQQIITQSKLTEKKRNIGLVIGSKLERNKWPLPYFKQVVEYFVGDNYNVLIFGGADDKQKAETLKIANTVFNFCGSFTPLQTAEAMRYCSVVITNDTGPMHLSYLVKTPVVALFSSRDFPRKWYPPEDGLNKVFRSENISCSICFTQTCSDNICLKKISSQQVIEAAKEILNKLNLPATV